MSLEAFIPHVQWPPNLHCINVVSTQEERMFPQKKMASNHRCDAVETSFACHGFHLGSNQCWLRGPYVFPKLELRRHPCEQQEVLQFLTRGAVDHRFLAAISWFFCCCCSVAAALLLSTRPPDRLTAAAPAGLAAGCLLVPASLLVSVALCLPLSPPLPLPPACLLVFCLPLLPPCVCFALLCSGCSWA